MSGYPQNPPGYGYGHPPSQPYTAAQYGAAPPQGQQPYAPYGAPSAPSENPKPPKDKPYGAGAPGHYAPSENPKPPKDNPYGASPAPSAGYGYPQAAAPYAPSENPKPPKDKPYGASPAPSAGYGYPQAAAPYAPSENPKPPKDKPYGAAPAPSAGYGYPPAAYGTPFASLVPSAFPPGTDPNVVACFQMADQDGSGFIDDKELQRALSSYNQSFSLRTVHLLMYLFTNTNTRKIGPKEFTAVFYSLQSWRGIFERFDRDRSGKIDSGELRESLLSLGFAVSPTVLELLVSKFDKTGGKSKGPEYDGGKNKGIEYDSFIECCLTVKGLTEKFKEKDTMYSGSATFTYESFMLTVLPFLIA